MSDLTLTPIELFTLVGLGERPRYGYELVERIDELSGGRVEVRPGNLYRVIHRLVERGWAEEASEMDEADPDARRRYFRVTPDGRRVVARDLEMYAEVRRALEESKSPAANPASGQA